MITLRKTAVIGAGSWGSVLALAASFSGDEVVLWTRSVEQARTLAETRMGMHAACPDHLLPDNVRVTADLRETLDANLVLVVVPSVAMRSVAAMLRDAGLSEKSVVLSCTKGIEKDSLLRMSEILREYLPNTVGVLSGPNHAEDICLGLPSATLVGFEEEEISAAVQRRLASPSFRIYSSSDLVGMELGGSIKNVFAIGAGICDGLGLGDNAKAAMVTRGLAEMTRIGLAYGGKAETFMGLSGMGDLIVTCYSKHSRNLQVGRLVAEGKSVEEAVASLGMVAEGVPNTLSIYQMSRKANARTPIVDVIYGILYEGKYPLCGLQELMDRALCAERIADN